MSTCAEPYTSCVIVIDDLENFISIAFSVENFPMVSKDDKIDLLSVVVTDLKKSLKKLFQESTLSPYNYDFPERFVQQCYLHFFSCDQAALQMVFASVCPSVRLSVRPSVRPSVCLSHLFDYVPIIVSS